MRETAKLFGLFIGIILCSSVIIINACFAWTGSGMGNASNTSNTSVTNGPSARNSLNGFQDNWAVPSKSGETTKSQSSSGSIAAQPDIGDLMSYAGINLPWVGGYFADRRAPDTILAEAQNASININQRIYDLKSLGIVVSSQEKRYFSTEDLVNPLLNILQTDNPSFEENKTRELKTTALDVLVKTMPSNKELVQTPECLMTMNEYLSFSGFDGNNAILLSSNKISNVLNTLSELAKQTTDSSLKAAYKDTVKQIYSKCTEYNANDWETPGYNDITDGLIENIDQWQNNGNQLKDNININLNAESRNILGSTLLGDYIL